MSREEAMLQRHACPRPAAMGAAPTGTDGQDLATHSASVLVAEDNAVNREVARRLLESLGCHVEVVPDGKAAIDAVRRRRYEIVFLDCQMPNLDGYQAAGQIRILEQERSDRSDGDGTGPGRLPVIALTGDSMTADRERSLASGMDDCLSSPSAARISGTCWAGGCRDQPNQDSSFAMTGRRTSRHQVPTP